MCYNLYHEGSAHLSGLPVEDKRKEFQMPIIYKVDVLAELKSKGITSYKMRKDKIMGERTMQQLRDKQLVSWDTLTKICEMLDCKPGDLLDYIPDDKVSNDDIEKPIPRKKEDDENE